MYKYKAIVDYVVDGDTVDLSVDLGFDIWHKTRVRVNGLDTPEKWFNYGKVVKAYAEEILQSRDVEITTTKEDKYGRYLVELFVEGIEGSFNQHLIDQGMAKEYNGASRANLWTEEELARTDHELLMNKLDKSVFK